MVVQQQIYYTNSLYYVYSSSRRAHYFITVYCYHLSLCVYTKLMRQPVAAQICDGRMCNSSQFSCAKCLVGKFSTTIPQMIKERCRHTQHSVVCCVYRLVDRDRIAKQSRYCCHPNMGHVVCVVETTFWH